MTRDKFLQELRIALQGRVPQREINEQLRYYENYIIEESRKGRTEEEVLKELGNPRLIAKTISDTFSDGGYYEGRSTEQQPKKEKHGSSRIRAKWIFLGIILAIVLVLLVRIGILLLPIFAAMAMISAVARLIFMIFYGNKK